MRILQILPELNVGGVETGTVDFAKYLSLHNHHAVVVSNGGVLVQRLIDAGVKHYTLPVHKKSLWTFFKSIKVLRQIIQSEKVDIVHARSRVPGWIAYFACRRTNAKYITTCHGHYSDHFFSRVMGWAKYVIVPSQIIGKHMVETFGVPSDSIRCISRSVDLERFKKQRKVEKDQTSFTISIVGRLTPIKGHVYFLKAMAKVVRIIPYVKIWIIGDASPNKIEYKKDLELLVKRLGLSGYVEFLGNRQDVPDLLTQTDVLVLSSTIPESFGRVIIEAQSVGVPVVATSVGGVTEIIDQEKTGLLVLPKDTEAMAQAVLRLLKDKKLVRSLVKNAKEKIKDRYTLEHMSTQTIGVYQELMDLTSILVIKMSAMGDVVLVTASLKALRKKYPHAKIYCLVDYASREILQRCPYINDLIVMDTKQSDKGWWGLLKFSRKLASYGFDSVIDFQNNHRSHLLAFLSFPKKSFGFHNKKFGFLLSHPVENPKYSLPPVKHQFQILNDIGIEYSPSNFLELWPSSYDDQFVKNLLESEWLGNGFPIVGVNLAASEKWETKNWSLESMARLCDLLAAQNIRVVLTGMEKDKPSAKKVMKLTKSKPASLVGKTNILELAVLIKRCKVYITPDSAPLHIAAAMKTPVIALFGPTDPCRHMPPAKWASVIRKDLDCSPCYNSMCQTKNHDCMKMISPEEVFEQVNILMAESKT